MGDRGRWDIAETHHTGILGKTLAQWVIALTFGRGHTSRFC